MDIKHQQFEVLYKEYINDYNLILLALHRHHFLKIYKIDKLDIQYFIDLFIKEYNNYQSDICNSFQLFVKTNDHIIVPTKSGLFYLNSNNHLNDVQDILNHYNKIYTVLSEYDEYLLNKYPVDQKDYKQKIYRHVKKII